jgi:hypothetical protein
MNSDFKDLLRLFAAHEVRYLVVGVLEKSVFIPTKILQTQITMPAPDLTKITTEAIAYWEKKRIAYNVILAVITATAYFTSKSEWVIPINFDSVWGLFFLAVIANVLYCAAYIPDAVLHISDFRERRHRVRPVLFAIGTLFASLAAFAIASGGGD